jgi:predicted ATPase/class 3 adenylate cyclase
MSKLAVERIEGAIGAIEERRLELGEPTAQIALQALHDLLVRSVSERKGDTSPFQPQAQRKQMTILFARVTGMGGWGQLLPNTDALNLINALWRVLDKGITDERGAIDKHMGDAVMGLFGVPVALEDDPKRAIRAALAMRAALSEFVLAYRESVGAELDVSELTISVGINTGPVLLGRVADNDEYTVIGDTVNVASRMEKAAPRGGILISHETYVLVSDMCNVEPLGALAVRGRSEPVQAYLVLGIKPRLFYASGRGVEGVQTQMVGRTAELAGLKAAMQLAMRGNHGRAITIMGEAGVGKSRLIHEFEQWVEELPEPVLVLKGRVYLQARQIPFALLRDLFGAYFAIQDNDPALVVEEKLLQGFARYLTLDAEELRQRVVVVSQLLGLDLGRNVSLEPLGGEEAGRLWDLAVGYIGELLQRMTAVAPGVLMILEDLHWADAASLNLLQQLLPLCRQNPLLMVLLTRPVEEDAGSDGLTAYPKLLGASGGAQRMQLTSLTEVESRELVLQILQKMPVIPQELANLIVVQAEGNPFYVEEIIKILIDDGVIVAGEEEWQIRSNRLSTVRVPPHITGVLQARLDRLSELERVTLQRAAVIGRVFWDSAVMHMNETAVTSFDRQETAAALRSLEKREMVFRRQVSGFTGSSAYVFKHAILQQVAYESVLLRLRPGYHKQAGDWFADQSGERVTEYASVIGEHYELGGEAVAAAEMYEMAAVRARDSYNLSLAVDYFRRSLALVLDMPHLVEWQLRLQEELGRLLHIQARLVEAAQIYMTMRFTAEGDGNLAAQARAWNALAQVQREQGQFRSMINSAKEAEQAAWLVGVEEDLLQALLLQGEGYLRLGEQVKALPVVQRAVQFSERLDEMVTRTHSLYWLTLTLMSGGDGAAVEQTMYQLEQQLKLLLRLDELPAAATTYAALGRLWTQLGRYEEATTHLLEALALYRVLDEQIEVGQMLLSLGENAQQRGDFHAAAPFFRKAVSVMQVVGDVYGRIHAVLGLGSLLVSLGNHKQAQEFLQTVLAQVTDVGMMAGWRQLPVAYGCQAENLLGLGQTPAALETAVQAHELAVKQEDVALQGMTWRVLGRTLVQMSGHAAVNLQGQTFTAGQCFAESQRVLAALYGGGRASYRELALTLWAWAAFEASNGQAGQGERLRQQAEKLAAQIGLALPRY